jgi:hypothetical protein
MPDVGALNRKRRERIYYAMGEEGTNVAVAAPDTQMNCSRFSA